MGAPQQVSPEEIAAARAIGAEARDAAAELARGDHATVQATERRAKRIEAVALRLAGFSVQQIAERLQLSEQTTNDMITQSLENAEQRSATELRQIENQRLDRAQAAIWSDVIAGNIPAVQAFLRISQQRSRINGLNAPTKIDMSVGIRHEMEQALAGLESLVKQQAMQVIDAEYTEIENEEAHDYVS